MKYRNLCQHPCLFCQQPLKRKPINKTKTFNQDHRTVFYCKACKQNNLFYPFSLIYNVKTGELTEICILVDNYKITQFNATDEAKCLIHVKEEIYWKGHQLPRDWYRKILEIPPVKWDLTSLPAIQTKLKLILTFS